MNGYIEALKKYAVFEGRSGREEFWSFSIINAVFGLTLMVMDAMSTLRHPERGIGLATIVYLLYSLAMLTPTIAVSVRRLHDIDKSGQWLLIGLFPCVGLILLLVWNAQAGTPGWNQYGPSPKEGVS